MTTDLPRSQDPSESLRNLFGDNRAEWPPEHFGALFVEPAYFSKLTAKRPCLLVGGRGTGKTTTLKSLRFDATAERLESSGKSIDKQMYLGLFVRMNKNRVRAFAGRDLDPQTWQQAFAHYFNLLVCSEFCSLAAWLERIHQRALSVDALQHISLDLAVTPASTIADLHSTIIRSITLLEVFINNPASAARPLFSMAEAPLRCFALRMEQEGLLGGRTVFCCIDEYENLLDEQQAILNTYIKHSEPPLSYKVGVRQNGLRNRNTLSANDLLQTPDDYREIDIADEGFEDFAIEVARLRLERARTIGCLVPASIDDLLDDLSLREEAVLLGCERIADEVRQALRDTPELASYFATRPASELYFLKYWAESENTDILELANDWLHNESQWQTRLDNYGYSSLFWLSHGRKGARIRKHYCGTRVLLSLASGNIRYFLELLETAISIQQGLESRSTTSVLRLSPLAQTLAAREVGRRRLTILEGLAEHGVELKRLVLGIGKVLFELARSPLGRTPEVTSFVVTGANEDLKIVCALLQEGVAYLAFEASPRTKATSPVEMKDDEYRLHPIFSAFFEISHRRKRRTTFSATQLRSILTDSPGRAISSMLASGRQTSSDQLPEQLAFFSTFFEAGDAP